MAPAVQKQGLDKARLSVGRFAMRLIPSLLCLSLAATSLPASRKSPTQKSEVSDALDGPGPPPTGWQ